MGHLLRWGKAQLQAAGVETARLDAELLLGAVLDITRAQLLARIDQTVGTHQTHAYQELVARRADGEPVAYILGRREFYGREFIVDPRVLIPRPETELVVELALAHLTKRPSALVADIGTGSGAIAVTLAAERPDVRVIATDISPDALDVARLNARRHGVADRVDFRLGHLLDPVDVTADVLCANLPYVGTDEAHLLPRDVLVYEPHEALFAGRDGLTLLRELLTSLTSAHVRRGGVVLLEVGYGHGQAVVQLACQRWPREHVHLHKDLAGFDRVVEIVNVWADKQPSHSR
ncbi:MAG: peptide chain release factor N(5)-glutamine methyltransferase [Ardenticatenia bacterium]|nr:peptide chain release factor N(5)-glutamine methyltransferase [Ardenticatenia bacterium]